MELQEPTRGQPAEPSAFAARARSFDPDALTRALRIAGAALVVASASTFMLQHWGGGNDLTRYAMLVGQSLLLAAAAYFVGLSLHEGRSARTFLALVLATTPVSFAVLGGLVYSRFHLEAVATLPSYATWIAPSAASAALAVAASLVVFLPLGIVSFVALARKAAKPLTLAFFAANLLMIVPVREPRVIVLLAGLALVGLLQLELTRFAGRAQLDTLEGKLARVMPFAPPLIMLGRVFHLYQAGTTFMGGLLLIAAAALWLLLARATVTSWRDTGAWLAACLGILGWGLCCIELTHQLDANGASGVLLWGLPAAAVFAIAGQRAVQGRRSLLSIAVATALGTTLLATAVDFDGLAAVGCLVVGVAVAVWGASMRALFRTAAGSAVALFGLVIEVWLATHADNLLRWASLCVVGVLLIVGSAYVERNRGRLGRVWEAAAARRLAQEKA